MDGLDLKVWPCHPHGSWQRALAHQAVGLPVDDEDAKALAAWDKEGKTALGKQSLIKKHRQYVAHVAAAARELIEPGEVVGCFELARRVAQDPDMPRREEVADVLKSLKPWRRYGGLTKRYIDNLSGHPGHYYARRQRDIDIFIAQRKAYRAEIARRALALNIHAGEERERKHS
ncbi:MAG: hypothetical protein E7C83_00510 [Corynebacterium sp.]|uniref:hypothetical protein n=1 Tax=Corynebacterium sp. TaxID=1720 RepID=UPI002900DC03|nr:hypothetical protein [Corynebacterium sp.]MDU2585643.1 hypothetical protein [Corynebacterium sp.]